MAESSRIDELTRRLKKDPASLAFAQLAEEHRRAGQFEDAVNVSRVGLALHPAYPSARVTLGRALLALGRLDDAQLELHTVLVTAPDNLAAVRSLAEIFQRRGESGAALSYYQQALNLARGDRELQQTVADLTRDLATSAPHPDNEPKSETEARIAQQAAHVARASDEPPDAVGPALAVGVAPPAASPLPLPSHESPLLTEVLAVDDLERQHALQTIAALEHWLTALNGPGADRHP